MKVEEECRECGRETWCKYDDDDLKKFVPKENIIQVLHKATATRLFVGIFVTAKIEEDQGIIVQIVITLIPLKQKLFMWRK